MQSTKTLVFIFLLFFLTVPKTVFAGNVVINEFLVDPDSQQWVEIYNKGTEAIDISGWFIDDDGGTQKFTIPAGTVVNSTEFKVFESSYFNLNRANPDTVKLLNGEALEDSYAYNVGPGENNSYGREVDGIGNWVVFNSPTKNSTNNTSIPVPTSTPTPTPTSIPTDTPTPTKIPTPTKTPTPIKTPTPSPTPKSSTPTPIKSSPTPIKSGPTASVFPTSVLGESTKSAESRLSETAKLAIGKNLNDGEKKVNSSSSSNSFPIIFIVLGVVFIAACVLLSTWQFRKNKNSTENE